MISNTILQAILIIYIIIEFIDMRIKIDNPRNNLKDLTIIAIGKGIWISVFILLYKKIIVL